MTDELPDNLFQFIESTIPTYQAAEVLLFLAAHPERDWKAEDIVVAMRPVVVTMPAAKEYLTLFSARQIVTENVGGFRYDPVNDELEREVAALTHAYNEQPVTLIRTIYKSAERRIQAFADSFKLTRD